MTHTKITILSLCLISVTIFPASLKTKKIGDTLWDSKGSGSYAVTVFDRPERAGVSGYFDMGWESNSDTNSFSHQFGLQFSSPLQETVLFNSEIAFTPEADSEAIAIRQAWVDFKWSDELILRAGIVPIPFGKINMFHRPDLLETAQTPLFAQYVVPVTWADSGVGIHGVLDIGSKLLFTYEGYLINGLNNTVSQNTGLKKAVPSGMADTNKNKAFVGRLGVSPFQDFDLGTSYYVGKWDTAEKNTLSMIGVDFIWRLDSSIEILSEWAHAQDEAQTRLEGYYAEAHFKFLPEFLKNTFLTKGFKNPLFTLYVRYGYVDLDILNPGTLSESQCTLGLNYRPMESLVYKFEYEWDQGKLSLGNSNRVLASVAVGF